MAQVQNVCGEPLEVPAYNTVVQPGDTLTIPDDQLDSFQWQTGVWQAV